MTQSRWTVDAVLKMAQSAAVKHANTTPGDMTKAPDLLLAIDQNWALIKGRIGETQAAPLDDLIKRITVNTKAN